MESIRRKWRFWIVSLCWYSFGVIQNVINMVEWRILHSSVKPQEKYRSRVVWRITSVMWTPGKKEETRGPYKIKASLSVHFFKLSTSQLFFYESCFTMWWKSAVNNANLKVYHQLVAFQVVHAPILELPVLGCWDLFDTSTRPNVNRTLVWLIGNNRGLIAGWQSDRDFRDQGLPCQEIARSRGWGNITRL